MAEWEPLVPDVKKFLETNRDNYHKFQQEMQNELNALRHRPEIKGLIYSIYSRVDKQQGDALKKRLEDCAEAFCFKKEEAGRAVH